MLFAASFILLQIQVIGASTPNIWGEVQTLMYGCSWFRVYDFIELLHARMLKSDQRNGTTNAGQFATQLNEFFVEEG
jgi:hypothetical protein